MMSISASHMMKVTCAIWTQNAEGCLVLLHGEGPIQRARDHRYQAAKQSKGLVKRCDGRNDLVEISVQATSLPPEVVHVGCSIVVEKSKALLVRQFAWCCRVREFACWHFQRMAYAWRTPFRVHANRRVFAIQKFLSSPWVHKQVVTSRVPQHCTCNLCWRFKSNNRPHAV